MDYGKSVQQVLLRKIYKAEQDLLQLKLDYCRFVFGLTHRVRVACGDKTYVVRSGDVDTMKHSEDGGFTKPVITGAPAETPDSVQPVSLGVEWILEAKSSQPA
ncbi:hypothetical protein QVZ43_10815 [Marinobacter sp. chi1]|uniref:Uncharacterized protein n=1 Tax=Marinobacter suaedae TaxID=3057675 RepID=A0ABT8W1V9_9GAMM|nr:hypothetical protein [Marinobacter sp. chi1]MDO3722214.1 hypothetical protein [Marinobacter sp. chi1]